MKFGSFKMPVEIPAGLVDELVALCEPEAPTAWHSNTRAAFDPECARSLLNDCLGAVQSAAGVSLEPAHAYFRVYEHGSYVRGHTDRVRLDWTVSIMLRCDASPYSLEVQRDDGAWQPLASDIALINSAKVPHRRPLPYVGEEACVLMLHYTETAPRNVKSVTTPSKRRQTIEPTVFPALISGDEIAAIRAGSLKFGPGAVGGHDGVPPESVRKSTTAWLGRNNYGWLFDRLQPLADKLSDDLQPLARIQYGRYDPGGHYAWHQDASNPSFSRYRRVSLSIVLQHAEAGGHLEIKNHDLPDMQLGDCVLFDSSTYHRVTPVQAGVRESLVAWFEREREGMVVADVLSPVEVKTLLAAFTPDALRPSLHGRDTPPPGCSHKICWLAQEDPQWKWIFARLIEMAESFLPGVAMTAGTPTLSGNGMVPSKLMLAEYDEGDKYFMHSDSTRGMWNESQIVSMSLPLEDPDEGGEFEFRDSGPVDIGIGNALVFDSDMHHCVRTIKRGRRRVLVFWMKAI